MRSYTGVGSRQTPASVMSLIRQIAAGLGERGWTLRSGGANGADTAFAAGALSSGARQDIFLPWSGFNGLSSEYEAPTQKAMDIAATVHPAWDSLRPPAKLLHARNVHQVLGRDCCSPSIGMICWTPEGQKVGGTATAIRLAQRNGVPVMNLGAAANRNLEAEGVVIWLGEREGNQLSLPMP